MESLVLGLHGISSKHFVWNSVAYPPHVDCGHQSLETFIGCARVSGLVGVGKFGVVHRPHSCRPLLIRWGSEWSYKSCSKVVPEVGPGGKLVVSKQGVSQWVSVRLAGMRGIIMLRRIFRDDLLDQKLVGLL